MTQSIRWRKILGNWPALLSNFAKRESISLFAYFAVGTLAAAFLRLGLCDRSFESFFSSKYLPTKKLFDDPRVYTPYLVIVVVVLVFSNLSPIAGFLRRCLMSWWSGVTSGLAVVSFLSAFVFTSLHSPSLSYRLILAFTTVAIFFLFSFGLHLFARARTEQPRSEEKFKVPSAIKSMVGTRLSETDDPITTWEQDSLGRVSIVESISFKLMITKSPVVALFGDFGSGKTSILNLMRLHLQHTAIVVSFSTWLPGSAETLIAYLLNDIANECQKCYVVPGLRRSTRRLTKALAQNVPFLKTYIQLFPEETQRDDIGNLRAALARLPKPVIVLLDELDRMERDELLILLKVLRGISSLPNLSFVCAGERRTIVEMVKEGFNDKSNSYFEKFFPTSIPIPKVPSAVLKRLGAQRLTATFIRRNWLQTETEMEAFKKEIESLWDDGIAPFCRTLRAINSLANDVDAASIRLNREVHPIDLTLIELLRRFRPEVYEIVGRNAEALTGGEGILRGGTFLLERERELLKKQLIADLKTATSSDQEFKEVSGVLHELFPKFREIDDNSLPTERSHVKNLKRVSEARIFPAYFNYELPENIFSAVNMDELLQKMSAAPTDAAVGQLYLQTLDSMEKGSLKRDDFLSKFTMAVQDSMPLPIARTLALATVKAADKYTYDMLAAFGEAGHVLRILLRVAYRLPAPERVRLLSDCIIAASDDTMAFNILTRLSAKQSDLDLEVSLPHLYPAFITRMRNRYGRDVDAAKIDLSTADPWAFNYWGIDLGSHGVVIDAQDKAIQRDFWLRYIGQSRSRLAQAFKKFFLPANVSYSGDLDQFVENKIPTADLKRLYEGIPEDRDLSSEEQQSLRTLRRLLDGKFKSGVGINGPYADDEGDAAAAAE